MTIVHRTNRRARNTNIYCRTLCGEDVGFWYAIDPYTQTLYLGSGEALCYKCEALIPMFKLAQAEL